MTLCKSSSGLGFKLVKYMSDLDAQGSFQIQSFPTWNQSWIGIARRKEGRGGENTMMPGREG